MLEHFVSLQHSGTLCNLIKITPFEAKSAGSLSSFLVGRLQYELSKLLLLVLFAFLCRESISSQCVGWSYSEAVCKLITARQETASPSLRSAVIRTDVARETSRANLSPLLKTRSNML